MVAIRKIPFVTGASIISSGYKKAMKGRKYIKMHKCICVYFWEAFKNQSSNGVLHDHIVIEFKQRCHFCLQSKDIGFTHQSHFTVIFINILPRDAGLFIYALMLPATLNQTWLNKYTQPWCNRLFNFAAFLFTFSNSTAFFFLQLCIFSVWEKLLSGLEKTRFTEPLACI